MILYKKQFDKTDALFVFSAVMSIDNIYYDVQRCKNLLDQDKLEDGNFLKVVKFFTKIDFISLNFDKLYKKLFNGFLSPKVFIYIKTIIFKKKLVFFNFFKLILQFKKCLNFRIKRDSNYKFGINYAEILQKRMETYIINRRIDTE